MSFRQRFGGIQVTAGANPSALIECQVLHESDPLVVLGQIQGGTPPSWFDLWREEIHIDEVGNYEWDGEARYGPYKPREPGTADWNFEIGTRSERIKQSRSTVASYAPPGEQPRDFSNAINVTEGGVEGVEIGVPVCTFSETHYMNAALFTPAYFALLFWAVGSMNSDSFRIFAPHELCLKGVSGRPATQILLALTFTFGAEPNQTGLSSGGISGIAKDGWDYLWFHHEWEDDQTAHGEIMQAESAHVERVLRETEYGLLGLPDPWN